MGETKLAPTTTLNTGVKMPMIALGTWQSGPKEVEKAVYYAISIGYRMFDTATDYANEEEVGNGIKKAIKEGLVKREDLFIQTKLDVFDFHRVPDGFNESLEKLGTGYIDSYLMHWPFGLMPGDRSDYGLQHAPIDGSITFNEVWAEMEKLPTDKCRSIGVSNFTIANIKRLLKTAKVIPTINQVELHVNLPQQKLVDFLHSGDYGVNTGGKKILPQAYSPLAHGTAGLNNPVIKKIAAKHGATTASVLLSWNIQRGVPLCVKSTSPEKISTNLDLIKLDAEDFADIKEISKDPKDLIRFSQFLSNRMDVFDSNADSF